MNHQWYLDLAASGIAMPIAAHLELHDQSEPGPILQDGRRLGAIVEQTSRRYGMPLAIPLMDLAVEKSAILEALGIGTADREAFHFETGPTPKQIAAVESALDNAITERMRVTCEAIQYIAAETDLLPVGMCIGAFSLMTKLLSDPITPVFMYGAGLTAGDDPEVARMLACLDISVTAICAYVKAQMRAGARAIFMCEPAANTVYISPNQLEGDLDVFDNLVIRSDRRIKKVLDEGGADLILHDCGELTEGMVRRLASLDPAILSLGSSRTLWNDAALVPPTTVLFGNLPSKHFYSDEKVSREDVTRMSGELIEKMNRTGHPFILGTECDVLSISESESILRGKVDAMTATADRIRACRTEGIIHQSVSRSN